VRLVRFPVLFFLALLISTAWGKQPTVRYDLAVTIEPSTRELAANATITIELADATEIALAREFVVESLRIDGKPEARAGTERGEHRIWMLAPKRGSRIIEARWRGTLAPLDRGQDHRQTLGRPVAVTGRDGTFLPSSAFWYPQVRDSAASYRVQLDLPLGQRGLVPGTLLEESESGGRYRATFEFPHPSYGIDLMAGPYRAESRNVRLAGGRTLTLRTYLAPSVAHLSSDYLDAAAGFIELYDSWIGAYPFAQFSVVSSPTPTGFGMPTLTYLGESVLKLPFIRSTSLGHEVLHNWWGNGVYPDYARGNWSEGLTTFMADYFYQEREGTAAAREMRLGWLRDFAAIPAGHDRPLIEFTSRTHGTSQIVGYGKSAMLFLMLRDWLGDEGFNRGLRSFWNEHRFRIAGWGDLRRAFEAASGRDLSQFFSQWLEHRGAPSVRIVHASYSASTSGFRIELTIEQRAPAYALRIPIVVRTENGEETHVVETERERETFTVEATARPTALVLDPEFRVFRLLAATEASAILRRIIVAPEVDVAIAPPEEEWRKAAGSLATALLDSSPRLLAGDEAPKSGVPLLVLGRHEEVDRWLARHGLPPRPASLTGKGTAQVWALDQPSGAPLAVVSARDRSAIDALTRPLPHYGRNSYLAFDGARMIERGVWPSEPVVWRFESVTTPALRATPP